MDINLKRAIKFWLIAAAIVWLWISYGCASTEQFHFVVTIPETEIDIVSDRDQFDCYPCPAGTAAYFYRNKQGKNIIYILGDRHDGKYRTRALWLGHEVQEAMSFQVAQILNPHRYQFWMQQ